jgi:hypothetical protein
MEELTLFSDGKLVISVEKLEILRSELNFFVQIEPPNPSNPERPPGFGETVSKNFPANAGERTVSPKGETVI